MSLQRQFILVVSLLLVCCAAWYAFQWLRLYLFVKPPARPVQTEVLLTDLELEISNQNIPATDPNIVNFVRARHQPIRSLVSSDFSDLAFLRPLLQGKRVVFLGEASHGAAEFNWLRVRLVKYLHKELGYDVVVFESPLSDCDEANSLLQRSATIDVMKSAIYSVWHTAEMIELFEYVKSTQTTGSPLTLAGLDIQKNGASLVTAQRLYALLKPIAPELAVQVAEQEERILASQGSQAGTELLTFYRSSLDALEENRSKLLLLENQTAFSVDMAIQDTRSRIKFIGQLQARGQTKESNEIRDQGMAENLDFLLDRAYPNRKMVVLASNHHIAYQTDEILSPRSMANWMVDRRKPDMFSIGLFMGKGVVAFEDQARSLYRVRLESRDQLATIMASAGRKFSFMDFSTALPGDGSAWIFHTIGTTHGGLMPLKITPSKSYDAAIYIHEVTPPLYVN